MKRPKSLTKRQALLLQAIERRRTNGLPTVQRDLAETLGIRRDSLNKLLQRMRARLAKQGKTLEMPSRVSEVRVGISSLVDGRLI